MKQRTGIGVDLSAAIAAASVAALAYTGIAVAGAPRLTVLGGPGAEESGVPPPVFRLQAVVARAWEDSISTWTRRLQSRAIEVGSINLRFVPRLGPANCYGLYTGEGPAYCSGNQTVFVGTDAANRLMTQFGAQGDAGITFLIGHEIGHHIQNLHGRFHVLSQAIYSQPDRGPELIRRFELEADCLAGIWMHDSTAWANSSLLRSDMLLVLASIGDEKIMADQPTSIVESKGLHGTTEQRTRWFLHGAEQGTVEACDVLNAPQL